MEWPLWSLQVDEAGDGGGGMSGLNVSLDFVSDFVELLRQYHIHVTWLHIDATGNLFFDTLLFINTLKLK